MFEDHDEELEFWSRVPDGRFDRFAARRQQAKSAKAAASAARHPARPVGSRTHDGMSVDDTRSIPVVPVPGMAKVKDATQHVDPLLRRAGALAVAIALLVPVAIALRSGDDSSTVAPAATLAAVVSVAPAAVPASADTVAPAPAAAPVAEATVATIDIDALPEAIPVNTEAPKSTQAEVAAAPATAAAVQPTAAATPQTKVESAPAERPTCVKKYTVQAGDAWISIAKKAGVTTKELLKANAATSSTAIYPGRDICLPANATTPTVAAPTTTAKPTQKSVAPKPTTPTTPYVAPRSYSKAEVAQIIREVWPDDLEEEAIRIATRESNLVPTAKNYCCYGLFQIYYSVHQRWLAQMGVTSANQLFDPRTNALAALVLWNRSGSWAPWKL
ncbi:MAG: LysM peptidoglycan-binding domain-containing protein [Actinobacteria bacterium]|nr:LysM peptidoglycan-binding domain-containing protein [Actinomycetota bacterium]